jgi:hypothetical protein
LQQWTKCTSLIAFTKLIEKTFLQLFVFCSLNIGQPSFLWSISSNQSTITKIVLLLMTEYCFYNRKILPSSSLIDNTLFPFSLVKLKLAYLKNDVILLLNTTESTSKSK